MKPFAMYGGGKEDGSDEASPAAEARLHRRDRLTPFTLAVLAALAAFVLVRAAVNLSYPFALTDAETAVLGASWRISRGISPYTSCQTPPYVVTVYNPLFPAAAGGAMRVLGIHPAVTRGIALGFCLAACAVVYLFVSRETGVGSAGIVAAAFFLVTRHIATRAGHTIVDYPAVFFSLAGIYLVKGRRGARFAAAGAFALGFFSKQSALVGPAAAFAWLFFAGKRREALSMAATFALMTGAGLVMCGAVFGPSYFTNAFVFVSGGAYFPSKAVGRVAQAVLMYPVPAAGIAYFAWRGMRRRQVPLIAWYGVTAFAASFSGGMEGAGYSYFFDFAAALALGGGLLWPAAVESYRAKGILSPASALAVLQLTLLAAGAWPEMRRLRAGSVAELGDRGGAALERDRAVRRAYEDNDGMILCRQAAMEIGARARSAGTDLYKVSQLVRDGRLPADTMTRLVRPQRPLATLVIVPEKDASWRLFPEELMDAIKANYRVDYESAGLRFYVPKPPKVDGSPAGREGAEAGRQGLKAGVGSAEGFPVAARREAPPDPSGTACC